MMSKKIEEVRHLGEKKRPSATAEKEIYERDYSRYAFSYPTDRYKYVLKPGLSREVVEEISAIKNEPTWMREFRLRAYEIFLKKPMPTWGGDLSQINFDTITYYATPTDKGARSWEDVPDEVKKTFDRLGIPEAERKFLAGVGAQYDCLTADTMVFANPGAVPIAQIKPGQYVYSLDLDSHQIIKQRVLGVVEKGVLPVFEVKVAGRCIKATFNHPFLALLSHKAAGKQRRRFQVAWRYLSDLQVGDYIAIVKQLPDEGRPYRLPAIDGTSVYTGRNQGGSFPVRTDKLFRRQQPKLKLPEWTSESFMWFLGAYLGDGGLRRKRRGAPKTYVDMAFPADDRPCRQRLAQVLQEVFGYELRFDREKYRVRIWCTPLVRLLSALGFDATAKTKSVPSWVFSLPRSQKLAFIAGYIDSDGHVRGSEHNSDATLTSANHALLRDVQRLAITCGLRVSDVFPFRSATTYKGKTVVRTAYRLMLMGDLQSLIPYSVKVTARYKPRKYYHRYNSYHRVKLDAHTSDDIGFAPIESIRYVGFEPTYDIEVEGVHNFIAEGIVVHNSEVVYHSIREDLAKKGVIFLSMDDGLREYPDLVKEYIGTVIPPTDNKFAALNSAVWSGGCLTAEARLFTPDGGIKSIAEVRCGDRVAALSPKGELVTATVVAHIHSGRKPVYRFRVAGRTLEATSNHLFLTLEKSPAPLNRFGRKWVMRWQPLANLKVGDVIAIAKRLPWEGQSKPLPPLPPYRRNHHLRRSVSAPAQTSPDLLWLLGVWMGDGNTYAPHPHRRFINFALPEGDPVRQEAIRLLHKLFQYSVKTRNSTSFTVYSKALGEWLAELGFTGKAKTKRIPSWVFGLPLEERLAFLGGLLDSDGWVENEGKTVSFELANRKLIEDIKMLAISCGLFSDGKIRERERRSALLKRENRQIISGTTYACRITGDVALIGSRHPRWRALLDQARKHTSDKYTTVTGENFSSLATEDIGFAPIREKEYIGVRDVYDIQVEGFANFVANGIIAHNSFIYVPKGVHVEIPLQAYFRINAPQMGQFERTLIIADEGARVHYIEGCLPGGEQVSVGDRWVNIESLKPGDYIVADNGQKARVRATMVRPYRGEMLTIRPISPYNAFRLTPEHPVLVVRRADVLVRRRARNGWLPEVNTKKLLAAQPEYVPAGELHVGDFLVFPRVQPEGYNPKYTPELLKLLGYYLAEGSAFVNKALNMPVVSFSFGAHEDDIVAEVCTLIEQTTGKQPHITKIPAKHAVNVIVYSRELMDLCVEACGKGATTKCLSPELMALPPEQIEPLVEGYFRGDGNVCDKGNSVMYRAATASERLAQQLQELLARQGIYASIHVRPGGDDTIQGRPIHRQNQYIIVYTLDKRWSEIRASEKYLLVPIKSIERAPYDGFVFNLDVEGPNSYLVRGFAVHNCTAPIYSRESLHSAVVELIAKRGAHLRYTTLQNWSNDVYNLVTKRAVAYEDATVEWVDANIGCLTADTKVFLNPRGAVNITEINPNDWVYALDLNAMEIVKRPVKGVVCAGVKPVFKLITENHREIKATANHPFLALQRSEKHWQLVWKPLEQLQVGEYIALSQGLPDDGKPYRIDYQPQLERTRIKPHLPRETSEELMWLLGLYLGDGFIECGGNNVPRRVYLAIPENDPARPKLIKLLQNLFSVDWKPEGINVTINSAILADFLLSLGFSGTAREKRIPKWVFGLPLRQKLAFIEGYLDADGHIRRHQGKDGALYGQLTFASCNRALLEDLKLLMISCGLNPLKISSYSRERLLLGQYKGTYTTHYLNLPLGDLETIRAKIALRPSVEFVRVLAIEPLGEEPVYDIEVEGAHNFIANGLIVHNSRLTMKYPSVYMLGKGARADILSVAFAGKGQHQDTGGKAIHAAPYTTSTIVSKSVSKDGGRASYRGQLVVAKGAHHAKSNVRCDALILDERSRSDTYPYIEIDEDQVTIGHEATVGKVGDDQIFYLMSRGLSEPEALSMIVLGFMEPFTKTLPMEYAIEFNRLIQLEMEGSVG